MLFFLLSFYDDLFTQQSLLFSLLIFHVCLLFLFQLNGVDLTSVTTEQAMLELCKPTETVQILAQYNPTSK